MIKELIIFILCIRKCEGDLGLLKAKDLAQVFTLLPSLDAVLGTFAPVSSMSAFGIEIEKESLAEFFTKIVGVHGTGFALTNYLATSEKTSVELAIAYGLLARILVMITLISTTNFKQLGINVTKPTIGATIVSICTYGLLTEGLDSAVCANIITFLFTFGGTMLLFFTKHALKKAVGVEVKDKITETVAKFVGGYVLLSALQIGLLMHDFSPVKTVGYTALGSLPLFFLFCGISSAKSILGINVEVWVLGFMMIINFIAIGTLT